MNTVLRIILILAVALAVVGVTVAMVPVNGGTSSTEIGAGGPPLRTDGQQFDQDRPVGRPDGDADREGSGEGWQTLLKNVGVVGAITAAIVVLTLLADGIRKGWKRPSPVATG
jgi:hypothetical protein